MAFDIELSAIRHVDEENIETCNDNIASADGFGVYLKNTGVEHPHDTTFHLKDFTILDFHSEDPNLSPETCRQKAYKAAVEWAGALASHIGGGVDNQCHVLTSPHRYGEGQLREIVMDVHPTEAIRFSGGFRS